MTSVPEQSGSTPSRGKRDCRLGHVVSDVRDKTIKVRYEFRVKHRKYGKYIQRHTMLHAHDAHNEARVGDLVEVTAARRISKTKAWRRARIVRKA